MYGWMDVRAVCRYLCPLEEEEEKKNTGAGRVAAFPGRSRLGARCCCATLTSGVIPCPLIYFRGLDLL